MALNKLEMTNNPCIYCNGKVDEGKILCGDLEDIGEVTNIVKTNDGFEIEHWGGFANIASVKINFCPMCGRELNNGGV